MLPLLRTLSGPVSLRTIPQLCGHVVPNGSLHRVTTNLQAFRQLATKPKEVFRKDFLNKRYVPKVPPRKVKVVEEGDAFIQFISQAFKAFFIGTSLAVGACIGWGAYDTAYRKSTKHTFGFVYWVLSFFFDDEAPSHLEKEDSNLKAIEFKSAFLDDAK